jgi:glyoxylase-like metal-dependent hydrolase (beta-lactamase superfamily II)
VTAASVSRLSPLVRVVLAPNPSPMTLQGTNTYLIGDAAVVVIDPGPKDEGHLSRVLAEAERVAVVAISHRHPDHAEGAQRFAEMASAPLIAPADGETLGSGDARMRALATPGHSSDHVCFSLGSEDAVFTGDHILGQGTTVVAHPDGDMQAYLNSLELLRSRHITRMYPGHGPVIDHPRDVLDYYVSHRLEREGQVLEAIEAGDRTVEDIVERIYVDVDQVLHPIAALTVRAHLEKLRREGRLPAEIGSARG